MLNDLDVSRPVLLIGNGPSAKLGLLNGLESGSYYTARMNFFFLEEERRYGDKVDFYFWGLNNPALHDELQKHVGLESSTYQVESFFCPVPKVQLSYTGSLVEADPFYGDKPPFDHWLMVGQLPKLSRYMMSRPLPTMGLQALATLARIGFRRFYIAGMDFYSDKDERYAFNVPEEVRQKMDQKHFRPGYESGAHSLALDLDFLQAILVEFPDLDITPMASMPIMEEILARREPPKNYSNPAPSIGAMPSVPDERAVETRAGGALVPPRQDVAPVQSSDAETLRGDISNMREMLFRYETLVRTLSDKLGKVEELSAIADLNSRVQLNEQALAAIVSNASPFAGTVFLVHDMASYAGVYRPLKAFKEYIESSTLDRLRFVNVSKLKMPISGAMQILVKMSCRRVVVNSIAAFRFTHTLSFINNAQEIYIYLHETAWTIDKFKADHPEAYEAFLATVARSKILCVSRIQESYVRTAFHTKNTTVIYNSSENLSPPVERKLIFKNPKLARFRERRGKDGYVIGMVGSIQPRKGTELFANVARLFRDIEVPARFVWVGSGDRDFFKGTVVEAPGPKSGVDVKTFLRTCDVVFVTSSDDPFPLAPLEALALGVRVVCYEKIGTHEMIQGIAGCASFAEYNEESALNALITALDQPLDLPAVENKLRSVCDIDTFSNRLCEAIGVAQEWSGASESALSVPIFTTLTASERQKISMSVDTLGVDDEDLALDVLFITARSKPRNFSVVMAAVKRGLEARRYDDCVAVLNSAIAAMPDRPSLKRELAQTHLARGDLASALLWGGRAVEENPTSQVSRKLVASIRERIAWADAREDGETAPDARRRERVLDVRTDEADDHPQAEARLEVGATA